ncbi:TetR/AcrR family transcriptional regulator C-terminal domain-containing protein [Streptomyces sp. SID13031]|uniref:GntR family transcriptional regulator n=1 Tax=Streptomyces sp. SID13031 TaxID=2706046 RepID=UPI0013C97A42|nr:TetR/AcrR family transcriptional regulator C-terminal domain-containing protein [Streptomyces sp. SID13031]NEA37518.1 GntR family transcriptional regulator [Streptomyces sp. SID13031]
MAAPYQEIATEFRRLIASGKLQPGDRMPSTRALVREHGIAMATATKVLTTLQQDGLIHARPGVGTVVGPAGSANRAAGGSTGGVLRGAPVGGDPGVLSKEQVVRTAIRIADGEGLGALSMRRVAAELGFSTMALYRYVGGKDALLLQMVDTAFGDFPLPGRQPASWRAGIEAAARAQWAAYRAHLWLAGAVTIGRPQVLPNLLPHTDAVLRAVSGFGVDANTSMYAAITVFGYVRGVALNLEPEAQAEQDTGLTADEWADHQTGRLAALIVEQDLAGFRALGEPDGFDFDFDLDQLFEFGLGIVLDGLAVKLQRLRAPLR